MKHIHNNETHIPIYRAKSELFDEDYDSLLQRYHKSFNVQSAEFQSFYDCLSIQLMYWIQEFEENHDRQTLDKLLFEIQGMNFYKFFYNADEWYPYQILEKYDGFYINDDKIHEVKYDLLKETITFLLENNIEFTLSLSKFPKVFNIDEADVYPTIDELIKSKKMYFDGAHYFFINEKNYKRLMLYMNEQVTILNNIYRELELREIEVE
jgi:hypothetical protein